MDNQRRAAISQTPEGNLVVHLPNGDIVTRFPDGTEVIMYRDGTAVSYDPNSFFSSWGQSARSHHLRTGMSIGS